MQTFYGYYISIQINKIMYNAVHDLGLHVQEIIISDLAKKLALACSPRVFRWSFQSLHDNSHHWHLYFCISVVTMIESEGHCGIEKKSESLIFVPFSLSLWIHWFSWNFVWLFCTLTLSWTWCFKYLTHTRADMLAALKKDKILVYYLMLFHHHHHSLNCEGRLGTTDDFATSFLHFPLFSTALWDLPNSRPVHSLMLSSHLFLCLLCLLPLFTVPCKMVLARPDERETWPYHCSLRLFTSLLDLGTDFLVGNMVFVWDG